MSRAAHIASNPTFGDYFIADQVFVKYKIDTETLNREVDEMVILETKLTGNATPSTNQAEAFTEMNNNGLTNMEIRNKEDVKKAMFDNINHELHKKKVLSGNAIIYRVDDLADGSEITDVYRITN